MSVVSDSFGGILAVWLFSMSESSHQTVGVPRLHLDRGEGGSEVI